VSLRQNLFLSACTQGKYTNRRSAPGTRWPPRRWRGWASMKATAPGSRIPGRARVGSMPLPHTSTRLGGGGTCLLGFDPPALAKTAACCWNLVEVANQSLVCARSSPEPPCDKTSTAVRSGGWKMIVGGWKLRDLLVEHGSGPEPPPLPWRQLLIPGCLAWL